MKSDYTKKIIITGPESTGKTTLGIALSSFYNTFFYSEFAREYVEKLNRKYTFEDVEFIAKHQIRILRKKKFKNNPKLVFFDTGLIITKVWFQEVYGIVPAYLDSEIEKLEVDLHLLCYPDLKWVADNVRENGGEKRKYLYNKYLEELELHNFKYLIIRGDADKRYALAKEYLSSAYCL